MDEDYFKSFEQLAMNELLRIGMKKKQAHETLDEVDMLEARMQREMKTTAKYDMFRLKDKPMTNYAVVNLLHAKIRCAAKYKTDAYFIDRLLLLFHGNKLT